MKYVEVTHVDAQTGVPVNDAPAKNGPKIPELKGAKYLFGDESRWPAPIPKFYLEVDDDADLSTPGVIRELDQTQLDGVKDTERSNFENKFRVERNSRLIAVDRVNPLWMEQMTQEEIDEVRAYRQALLDVPQQTGYPFGFTWPDLPVVLGGRPQSTTTDSDGTVA